MNILITGGNGFIGSHLTGALIGRGYPVTVLCRTGSFAYTDEMPEGWREHVRVVNADIGDHELLERLVVDADVIFHKAASVGVPHSARLARHFVDTNIGGTATLIEVLRSAPHHVRKVILGSSVSVYGEGCYQCARCGLVRPDLRYGPGYYHRGDQQIRNPPCPHCAGLLEPVATAESSERNGESVYAITKKAQEDLLAATCRLLDISLFAMRYCTVYGPGQHPRNPYSEFMRRVSIGQRPSVNEDGQQTRDFVHVRDVVTANLQALDSTLDGCRFFNIGTGKQTAVWDFAQSLSSAICRVGRAKDVTPAIDGGFSPGDVRHCDADCSQSAGHLGFESTIALRAGIEELAVWFADRMGQPTSRAAAPPGQRFRNPSTDNKTQ